MIKSQITTSAENTQEIAAEFAAQILRQKIGSRAVVLGLQGDLGSGKTTFLQGFARRIMMKVYFMKLAFGLSSGLLLI